LVGREHGKEQGGGVGVEWGSVGEEHKKRGLLGRETAHQTL
jgi:hypothetical protein